MQENNLQTLVKDVFDNPFENRKVVKEKMKVLSVKNISDLNGEDIPDYLRLPSADELVEMRQWAIDYKKSNKSASKREVRKAVQSHFKIKIFK